MLVIKISVFSCELKRACRATVASRKFSPLIFFNVFLRDLTARVYKPSGSTQKREQTVLIDAKYEEDLMKFIIGILILFHHYCTRDQILYHERHAEHHKNNVQDIK